MFEKLEKNYLYGFFMLVGMGYNLKFWMICICLNYDKFNDVINKNLLYLNENVFIRFMLNLKYIGKKRLIVVDYILYIIFIWLIIN